MLITYSIIYLLAVSKNMKNYAKIGKRNGRPAYRTPALYRCKKMQQVNKNKYNYKIYEINKP